MTPQEEAEYKQNLLAIKKRNRIGYLIAFIGVLGVLIGLCYGVVISLILGVVLVVGAMFVINGKV